MQFDLIKMDYEVREEISHNVQSVYGEPEMTEHDSAFLCGLLIEYKPEKVLEVGVAAGYTTAIILGCLEKIGQKYQMHSMDYSEHYYRGNGKMQTGFVAGEYIENNRIISHQFHLGGTICDYIDDIGNDIDFLILDTMHSLPGELLDFLVLLPYLRDGAVVCLHDVSLNNRVRGWGFQNATNVLYHSVVGDKLVNWTNENPDARVAYPNIAAFRINPDTRKYIENVFLSLTMTWRYIPPCNDLIAYGKRMRESYSWDLYKVFLNAYG